MKEFNDHQQLVINEIKINVVIFFIPYFYLIFIHDFMPIRESILIVILNFMLISIDYFMSMFICDSILMIIIMVNYFMLMVIHGFILISIH